MLKCTPDSLSTLELRVGFLFSLSGVCVYQWESALKPDSLVNFNHKYYILQSC